MREGCRLCVIRSTSLRICLHSTEYCDIDVGGFVSPGATALLGPRSGSSTSTDSTHSASIRNIPNDEDGECVISSIHAPAKARHIVHVCGVSTVHHSRKPGFDTPLAPLGGLCRNMGLFQTKQIGEHFDIFVCASPPRFPAQEGSCQKLQMSRQAMQKETSSDK
jgi:hypothetical protein